MGRGTLGHHNNDYEQGCATDTTKVSLCQTEFRLGLLCTSETNSEIWTGLAFGEVIARSRLGSENGKGFKLRLGGEDEASAPSSA